MEDIHILHGIAAIISAGVVLMLVSAFLHVIVGALKWKRWEADAYSYGLLDAQIIARHVHLVYADLRRTEGKSLGYESTAIIPAIDDAIAMCIGAWRDSVKEKTNTLYLDSTIRAFVQTYLRQITLKGPRDIDDEEYPD